MSSVFLVPLTTFESQKRHFVTIAYVIIASHWPTSRKNILSQLALPLADSSLPTALYGTRAIREIAGRRVQADGASRWRLDGPEEQLVLEHCQRRSVATRKPQEKLSAQYSDHERRYELGGFRNRTFVDIFLIFHFCSRKSVELKTFQA